MALGVAHASAGAARDVAATEGMTLRLHELPRGFAVGDDSGCGALDTEGAEPPVAAWVVRYRPGGCEFQYERIYALSGPGAVPPLVESGAIAAGSEAGAKEGLALATDFLRTRTGRHSTPTEVPAPPVGAEARLFHSGDIGVQGRSGGNGSVLWWRDGEVLATLLVAGGAPAVNDRVAARLAALQQKHVETPTPYTETERDFSQVPLDDPRLKLPVYWLGAAFSPPAGLPVSPLYGSTVYPHRSEGPPGVRLELEYERGPRLSTWTRAGWRRYRRQKIGRINWTRSCGPPTRTGSRGGRATIFGVRLGRELPELPGVEGRPAVCAGPPNHHFAVVRLGRVVVGVDIALCYTCAEPHEGPYDSLRGMKAIVGGLRLRHRPAD